MCLLFQMYGAYVMRTAITAEECRPRPYIKSCEYPQLYSRPCNRSERSSLFLLYIHFILLCTYIVSTVTRFVVHFLFIVNKGLVHANTHIYCIHNLQLILLNNSQKLIFIILDTQMSIVTLSNLGCLTNIEPFFCMRRYFVNNKVFRSKRLFRKEKITMLYSFTSISTTMRCPFRTFTWESALRICITRMVLKTVKSVFNRINTNASSSTLLQNKYKTSVTIRTTQLIRYIIFFFLELHLEI
uniref:Uncharacterized protein n=1 Tax=Heterorhabditis bacteriophora TaxID=37862 RepID=A0A1I7X855_HETBA